MDARQEAFAALDVLVDFSAGSVPSPSIRAKARRTVLDYIDSLEPEGLLNDAERPKHPSLKGDTRKREVILSGGILAFDVDDEEWIDARIVGVRAAKDIFLLPTGEDAHFTIEAIVSDLDPRAFGPHERRAEIVVVTIPHPAQFREGLAEGKSKFAVYIEGEHKLDFPAASRPSRASANVDAESVADTHPTEQAVSAITSEPEDRCVHCGVSARLWALNPMQRCEPGSSHHFEEYEAGVRAGRQTGPAGVRQAESDEAELNVRMREHGKTGLPDDRVRDESGTINNCALANGDEEKNCQVCKQDCPDKVVFDGEFTPQEPQLQIEASMTADPHAIALRAKRDNPGAGFLRMMSSMLAREPELPRLRFRFIGTTTNAASMLVMPVDIGEPENQPPDLYLEEIREMVALEDEADGYVYYTVYAKHCGRKWTHPIEKAPRTTALARTDDVLPQGQTGITMLLQAIESGAIRVAARREANGIRVAFVDPMTEQATSEQLLKVEEDPAPRVNVQTEAPAGFPVDHPAVQKIVGLVERRSRITADEVSAILEGRRG